MSLRAGMLGLAMVSVVAAADWPQWRGPARDGKSAEVGLLPQWPTGGPPLLFSAAGFGRGYSSLAVADGLILTTGDFDDGQYVVAARADDGAPAWKTRLGPAHNAQYYPGARSSPTVAGARVYALGTEGDLVCLEMSDGSVVWRRNLQTDFGGRLMIVQDTNWRFTESPLIDGDRVVVTPGGPDAALVALNKRTGEEIWRAQVPTLGENGADGAAYSSIVVSRGGGVRQYVQLMGRGLVGVEAETGRFLWGYNRVANHVANVPTPIVAGDYVFASTAYQAGAVLLRLAASDDGVAAEEVYFLEAATFQNHHGGFILHKGRIYAGSGHNRGFPICLDFETGKIVWGPVRNSGEGSAAVTYADGRIYLRYENGLMILAEATPDGYRERGSFRIPDAADLSWSHPVISGGRLYLREQDELHTYDVLARPSSQTVLPLPHRARGDADPGALGFLRRANKTDLPRLFGSYQSDLGTEPDFVFRPRTGEVVPKRPNCEKMFPESIKKWDSLSFRVKGDGYANRRDFCGCDLVSEASVIQAVSSFGATQSERAAILTNRVNERSERTAVLAVRSC